MEQERRSLMDITETLMITAATCLILGLVADAVTDSDRAGNALILLAIIAFFIELEIAGLFFGFDFYVFPFL